MGLFGSVTDKLFKAAGAGDATAVARYAGRGADVNACNAYGRTPLTVAVFRPDTEPLVLATVTALLSHGADVNASDTTGNTALIFASWKGYTRVVEKLLAVGASLDNTNKDGNSALLWASSLGHVAIVRQLLEAGATVDCSGSGGKTPLYCAASKGYSEIAQLLLAAGADPLILSDSGRSSIASAERASHSRVASMLRRSSSSSLSHSFHSTRSLSDSMVQVDGTTMPSAPEDEVKAIEDQLVVIVTVDHNQTLLDAAAAGDLVSVTQSLVDGADRNTTNETGATALTLAARSGHGDVVETLLTAEPHIDAVDNEGNTALIHAASHGHAGIVAVLLVAGVDIHLANAHGETAATIAVVRHHIEVVRELVGCDASLLVPPHPSLLHCAVSTTLQEDDGTTRVLAFFVQECGVDPNAMDANNVSAFQAAVAADNVETVGLFLDHGGRMTVDIYHAATSPRMQATLLRHNHALYNARCVDLLHHHGAPPTIADVAPLVPLLTSVYDLRWLLTLVALCPPDSGRTPLLHAAFAHLLAMQLVFDTSACAYFKLMLESVGAAEWLSRLDIIELDRKAENINTESAAWVTELKRNVQANAWRLDAHEQCLRQVVDGVREVHAMVLENRRAVQATMGQLKAVQAQVVAAQQLQAQLARNTSQVVEQLHRRLELCEDNVVVVATSLQTFRDATVDRQQHEERTRKLKMLCGVVASIAGFVLAPVIKEIADAVVDLANPLAIVQYVYGETDIARFIADQSSKRLPLRVQEQLAAFEITTGEFEALLREEIVLKHPEYLAECTANNWDIGDLDGGRADTARRMQPSLEKESTAVLEITAELRIALRIVKEREASNGVQDKWRSPSMDLEEPTFKRFNVDKTERETRTLERGDGEEEEAAGATNQRELVVCVDDVAAFPFHAAVQQCKGDVTAFQRRMEKMVEDADADPNIPMRIRLCAVATWRESLCAAQYAYCLGHRAVGDLLAARMDPQPTFSSTAAAMAVELVDETDHVPYIDFIHESQGDAARCEHYLALVDEDEHPLSANVEADVVRALRSSSVAWTAVQYASHLGHVEVVKQLIQKHGKQLPVKERMQLLNHALAQRSAGRVAAHAG